MKLTIQTAGPPLASEESIEGVTAWPESDVVPGGRRHRVARVHERGTAASAAGKRWGAERTVGELPQALDDSKGIVLLARGRALVVAERYGLRGFVGRWSSEAQEFGDWAMIEREDYHAEHCCFPLALMELNGEDCLLHSTMWNQLEVTAIESGSRLTKRPAAENSEESEPEEGGIDYFHGQLYMSPDQTKFVSSGWVWSPYDVLVASPVTPSF